MKRANKWVKRKILPTKIVLIAVFIFIQFYHPAIATPAITAEIQLPANVKAIVTRACYDCHSNETNLRWYDKIAPVYWQGIAGNT